MIDLHDRGVNWAFFGWCALVYGVLVATAVLGTEVRLTSTLLAFAACTGLTYRLGTSWRDTSVLVHALTMILIAVLALGGFGQAQLLAAETTIPKTWVVWPIAFVRASCILIVVKWPKWCDRHFSPLLQTPPSTP